MSDKGGRVSDLNEFGQDNDPSPISEYIVDALEYDTRNKATIAGKTWLEGGPGTRGDLRGKGAFIEVS